METIKVKNYSKVPDNFAGIAEFSDGTKRWYKDGDLHREDGPAVIKAGKYEYYRYGKRHRLDGPAHIVFGTKSGRY